MLLSYPTYSLHKNIKIIPVSITPILPNFPILMRVWAHNDSPHFVYKSRLKLVPSITDPTIILYQKIQLNEFQTVPNIPKYLY